MNILGAEEEVVEKLEGCDQRDFLVKCFPSNDPLGREDHITIDEACLHILKNKVKEVNDTILTIGLR